MENPLVTWGEIAKHLGVSEDTAQRTFRDQQIPIFYIGRLVAVYPSTLKEHLEKRATFLCGEAPH